MFTILKLIKSFDLFGEQVPGFNLNGKTKIQTFGGAMISMIIFALTLTFSLLKFDHLINRKNPSIIMTKDALDESTKLKIENNNHMMAFAIEDYWTLTPLYDPSFIRFYGLRYNKQDRKWSENFFHLKPCTDEEFSKFYDYENKKT